MVTSSAGAGSGAGSGSGGAGGLVIALLGRVILGGLVAVPAAAAGQQGQDHDGRQNHAEKLFHVQFLQNYSNGSGGANTPPVTYFSIHQRRIYTIPLLLWFLEILRFFAFCLKMLKFRLRFWIEFRDSPEASSGGRKRMTKYQTRRKSFFRSCTIRRKAL